MRTEEIVENKNIQDAEESGQGEEVDELEAGHFLDSVFRTYGLKSSDMSKIG